MPVTPLPEKQNSPMGNSLENLLSERTVLLLFKLFKVIHPHLPTKMAPFTKGSHSSILLPDKDLTLALSSIAVYQEEMLENF